MIKCAVLVETIYKESERTNQYKKEMETVTQLIDKALNERVKLGASIGATQIRIPLSDIYKLNTCILLSRKDVCEIAKHIVQQAGYRTTINSSSLRIDWSHCL